MNHFKTFVRICLAVAALWLIPQSAQATHIVGGNMEYDILDVSNDSVTVRIKLAVYRDCFFGDPSVYFDDPAYIGVFDNNMINRGNMLLSFTGQDDTLNQGLDTFCLVNLQPVCVHTTSYEGTIRLPIRAGGYTFAYQRCCRNETINNITDPLFTGATFLIRVNDLAIQKSNHSPEFDNFPPIYLCANQPFVFENTASDLEGDSLVYELCTPFEGGTLNNPQPIPTFPPPYDPLTWAPGYSLANLLGTGTPLTINPQTGVMNAFPTTLGQFVIGVCVKEYDRETGQLLSINRRDFQYNVNPCESITADFSAPQVQCDDLTVLIENLSTSPPFFEYYANGVLFSTSDSSFLAQTFPDTGSYVVELVAVPNTICADTFTQTIQVVNNSIEPDFFFASLNCVDSTILVLNDISTDTVGVIDSFIWTVEFNGISLELTGPNPSVTLPSNVTGTITLTVINSNNCEESVTRPFNSMDDNPTDFILSERDLCIGDTVELNPFAPDSLDFDYLWAPAELLDDPTAQNPTATIDVTTTFSVTITNGNAECETVLETTINILETPVASYDAAAECGGLIYVFNNTSLNGDSYFYDFGVEGIDSDTSNLASPTFTYPGPGTYTVTFIVTNASGCTDTLIQDLEVTLANQIDLEVPDEIITCDSIAVITPSATLPVTYTYFSIFGDSLGTGPSYTVQVSGTTIILIAATDADGCKQQNLVTVSGGPVDLIVPDTVLACGVDEINFGVVNADPNDTLTYVWAPDSLFDPTTINDAEPIFVGPFGEYVVSVTATNQFGCSETYDVVLIVQDDNGTLDFTWEPECSGSSIMFNNTSSATFGFVWDFAGLGTSNATNPVFTFPNVGVYPVTLSTIYPDDCIESVTIDVTVVDVVLHAGLEVSDTLCAEDGLTLDFIEAVLNLTNDTLVYNWTFDGLGATPATATGPGAHSVTVNQSGDLMVTLMVESEDGCTSSYDTTINVQLAQIDLPTEVTICPGESVALNPNFNPGSSYLWSPAPDFDPTDSNPITSTAGQYSVIVMVMDGDVSCPAFDTITVIIADSIELTLTGPDGIIIPQTINNEVNQDGSNVLPEVSTCGDAVFINADVEAGIDVIWNDLSGNPVFLNNPGLFDPIDRDTVVAVATDQFGCSVSDTVVIVNHQVDVVGDPAGTISVCANLDTVVGVINLDPRDTLTYVWEPNPIIQSALDSAYVIIGGAVAGNYELEVLVSNQFGCDTILTFDIVIEPFEVINFPADTLFFCFEQPGELNPGGVAVPGYTYVWDPMVGDFSNPANPIVSLQNDQLYTVTITNGATNCQVVDSIFVVVANDLEFEGTPLDTSLCLADEVAYTTTHAANVVVSWYDELPFVTPVANGDEYTILVDEIGLVTTYAEAIDTLSGCRDTLVFTAELIDFDPGMLPDTIQACFGEPTELNPGAATDPNYTYQWTPDLGNTANPTVTVFDDTSFTVVITDPATGCVFNDTVFVSVSEEIALMLSPQDSILCNPDTITILSTNSAGATVVWFSDPELTMMIGEGPTFELAVTETGSVTIYALATEPEFGCLDTASVTASLQPLVDGLPADNVQGCVGGEPISLFPGGINPNYVYTYLPANAVDLTDPNNPVWVGNVSGVVTVTTTNPETGCTVETMVQVEVIDLLNLEGSADPDTIILGDASVLTVTGCDGDCNYVWNEPNGTIEVNGSTATVTPSEPGEQVYLVEVNNGVCTEIVEITVFVIEVFCITERVYLPNAFSPNGDNVNDVLKLRSTFINEIEEFELMIFNRWGQQMYRSFDPLAGWDGTFQGEQLSPDVYGFYLRVVCPDGEELIQKGNITLLK